MDTLSDVLVTGGAGAIGSRLVRRLLQNEDARRIVVLDDLSSGYDWLLPRDSRVQLVKADVCNVGNLEIELRRPVVFHLAAFFANQNSVDHPLEDLHTNGLGTLAVLEWAKTNGATRVVYSSAGCSIAGHGIDGAIHEDMPVSLFLDTPYQITKALGEFYCNYYLKQVSTVRCRFFNSYGPGEVPGRYRNVIPNFIWRALNGMPLVITGTGNETRDFIYVEDLVQGLLLAAQVKAAHGEAINLGTGVQTKVIDLAQMVIGACGSKSRIEYAPRRAWDQSTRREANIDRAQNLLGLKPVVSVRDGVAKTVEWFRENLEHLRASVKAEP